MIKIIVSSFYNTLINKEEAIEMSTMLEIDRIRNKGILFTISTNGLYKEVLDYNKDFPFIDYIISLNGSYVYDVLNKKCIYKQKISKLDVKKIYQSLKKYKIYYYTEDKIYTNYNEVINKDVYKIEVETNNLTIENENCRYSYLEKDNKKYLEIISSKCNSYIALNKINEINNILKDETLVIIGNDSDIELVNNIDNNYVVENSSKKLKSLSQHKTKSNINNGVEKVLKTVK